MSDTTLTALSTLAWIFGTTALFALLARWSDGGSWGIAAGVTRGLIGWTGRNGSTAGQWSRADDVPPIESPQLDRLWGTRPKPSPGDAAAAWPATEVAGADAQPIAEVVDLGTHRLV